MKLTMKEENAVDLFIVACERYNTVESSADTRFYIKGLIDMLEAFGLEVVPVGYYTNEPTIKRIYFNKGKSEYCYIYDYDMRLFRNKEVL